MVCLVFFDSKQADGFTKTGCYNTLCPGFVQVSKRVPLGILLEPVSVYDGHQSEVGIVIYKVTIPLRMLPTDVKVEVSFEWLSMVKVYVILHV